VNKKEVSILDAIKAKAIRLYLNESQVDFAKRLGVAASTVCAIEKGDRQVSDLIRARLTRIEMSLPDDFIQFYEKFRQTVLSR
jgi:DNA-binding XRE family transcriptional regulator